MKSFILVIGMFLVLSSSVKSDERKEFLMHFVSGKYHLIGKSLDSDKVYYGNVKIENDGSKISVKRTINGNTIKGLGAIEKALGGEVNVLRIRFVDGGVKYEQTCMIASDLDNNSRITCYLYQPNKKTHNPGLEALFIIHEK